MVSGPEGGVLVVWADSRGSGVGVVSSSSGVGASMRLKSLKHWSTGCCGDPVQKSKEFWIRTPPCPPIVGTWATRWVTDLITSHHIANLTYSGLGFRV